VVNIKHISLPSETEKNYFLSFLRMKGEDIKNEGRDNKFFLNFYFFS